jgi:alpha-N-arabinofuranosidase
MEERPVSELKFMCFFLPGNYLKFYNAIRSAYPDIKIISNCDGSSRSLDHPADYYDYHVNILS